ncbi:MAG: dihydrofolate reductase [Paraglaciecola sp.]|jgi:dihydrofolate reductase
MLISMIAAMANNRVIGANNAMPWHLSADLQHFKQVTLGKPIIMGRRTYQSIGRALPGRINIVISGDKDFKLDDAIVVSDCEQAVAAAEKNESEAVGKDKTGEMMIIGGGTIYQHFMPLCQRLYLTKIDLEIAGDTYFPDYELNYNWRVVEEETFKADTKNPYNYHFMTLIKQAAQV